ncbi:MAG TPA: M28 family peptidase [Vicinamibacterales bacterium]|nr:M28 family peptidase [Vicinamibacterales bacterium]
MRACRSFTVVAAAMVLGAACAQRPAAPAVAGAAFYQPPPAPLPPSAERAYRAVEHRVDGQAAFEIVRFMDQYWRLAANPGFDASIDHIHAKLAAAGFADRPSASESSVRVEEFPAGARGWDYRTGTVAFADDGEVLLSREQDRVSLCINSFSTPAGGLVARLVDAGSGSASGDYAKLDVKGAIVLGNAAIGRLWQQAVVMRGAAGVISTSVAPYIRPDNPAQFASPSQQDVLQWGSIPYDASRRAFGFKASWRAAARMRARLTQGPVKLRVTIASNFYDGPSRALIAEIPGTSRPAERIVMVAHVQEPGANDDGSGCGTLYALAVALKRAIAAHALPPPGRTLTFMWADEVRGSEHWLKAHPDEARETQYMMALDMTGEDTSKTGGTFLIEKQPDPTAVWPRPSDPHTAWGASRVSAESLKGSLLNDLHLAICLRRAKDTGWVVRTNPYEGGSDHTAFGAAGIPALLNWHFTDRYYHTNQDRPDKTSVPEMVNVGTAVATTSWFLASADEHDALAVADFIAASADARLALEARQGRLLVAMADDRAKAQATEAAVAAAWRKWYREALESVRHLAVSGASSAVDARVAAAQQRLR